MINIAIKEKKVRPEGFYVTIRYMHGDADAYSDRMFGPFPNKESFVDFLEMVFSIQDNSNFWGNREFIKGSSIYTAEPCTALKNLYWVAYPLVYNTQTRDWEYIHPSIPEEKQEYVTKRLIASIDFTYEMDARNEDYHAEISSIDCIYVDNQHIEHSVDVEYEEDDDEDEEELEMCEEDEDEEDE